MKHFLSLEPFDQPTLVELLDLADQMKKDRGSHSSQPLSGQTWAMIFSKSSTRTRVSFEVGIRELGGKVLFLAANEMQLGRGEPIKDTARVLGRMVHGAVIRTYDHQDVIDFAHFGNIPTINALTDHAHPCQIMADLMTIRSKLGDLSNKVITFVGDGACNVATSWIYAAMKFGFELRIASPKAFSPDASLIAQAGDKIKVIHRMDEAVAGSHVLYTDVAGFHGERGGVSFPAQGIRTLPDQYGHHESGPSWGPLMHCLPAYRGKEVTEEILEGHADTIFEQAENRLHAQKAILSWLAVEGR